MTKSCNLRDARTGLEARRDNRAGRAAEKLEILK